MDCPTGYSIAKAREKLGDCSRTQIYRLLNAGKLASVKVGSRTLITEQSIRALLEPQQIAA